MIMPIPGVLIMIVILIGAACKLDEYHPTYKHCSDCHCDNSYRRRDSEFHFDLPYRIGSEEYPHSDQHHNSQDSD
jgi:hypothetical protein